MPIVAASQFVRAFGQYQDEAFREIVRVTSHGRVVGGYLSADELANYERLKRRAQETLVVGELPDDAIADIQAAEYDTPAR